MKDLDFKQKFIEMRASGSSYDEIAKKLNKSKTTLVRWNKELENEISNIEFFEYQALIEKHRLTKKARIEFLTEEIDKIKKTMQDTDYKKLTIRELMKLLEKFETDLKKEIVNIEYHTGEMIKVDEPFSLSDFDEEITVDLY